MSTQLTQEQMDESNREYVKQTYSPATTKGFRSDFRQFSKWCEERGFPSLPTTPVIIASYVRDNGGKRRYSTLERHISSIGTTHTAAGFDNPTLNPSVRKMLRAIGREYGTHVSPKTPADITVLRRMVATVPDTLLGARNRAMLLLGFAGGFRSAEIVSFDVDDVEFVSDGMVLRLKKSKTDQAGEGRLIPVLAGSPGTCPVQALKGWLAAAQITEGPIFRPVTKGKVVVAARLGCHVVRRVVKECAESIGEDPVRFGGHSLRSGMATTAAASGSPIHEIMSLGDWKTVEGVKRYIRHDDIFKQHPMRNSGL